MANEDINFEGPLDNAFRKVKDKIGFVPLMPNYTFKDLDGPALAIGKNIMPTAAAMNFYYFFEESVQNVTPIFGIKEVHDYVDTLPASVRDPLKYQGSDFFGAPVYSAIYGTMAMEPLRIAANLIAPNSKATKFIENNYLNLRNGVGFGALVYHEVDQALDIKKGSLMDNLDVKDIGAYALGIAAFCYAPKMAYSFYKGTKQLFERAKKSLLPTTQDKAEQQLHMKL
ncbi:MAG: hypothetical protein JWM96_844 [Alphaproteobacteria bacterium]|nr:hypothetical protein [Alphaproteobacteria bacterium]